MLAPDHEPSHDAPRCERCGEVIGVYERLVRVIGERVQVTSRAAEPRCSRAAGGAVYHAACFEPRCSDDPAAT